MISCYRMSGKYPVITLCGLTRFKGQFLEAQKRLTLEGNIVISVGLFDDPTRRWPRQLRIHHLCRRPQVALPDHHHPEEPLRLLGQFPLGGPHLLRGRLLPERSGQQRITPSQILNIRVPLVPPVPSLHWDGTLYVISAKNCIFTFAES